MLAVTLLGGTHLGADTWPLLGFPVGCLPSTHLYLHPYIVINHNCAYHCFPVPIPCFQWIPEHEGGVFWPGKRLLAYWFCWNEVNRAWRVTSSQTSVRIRHNSSTMAGVYKQEGGSLTFLTLCYFVLAVLKQIQSSPFQRWEKEAQSR